MEEEDEICPSLNVLVCYKAALLARGVYVGFALLSLYHSSSVTTAAYFLKSDCPEPTCRTGIWANPGVYWPNVLAERNQFIFDLWFVSQKCPIALH